MIVSGVFVRTSTSIVIELLDTFIKREYREGFPDERPLT